MQEQIATEPHYWLKHAALCALVPALLGSAIFFLWLFTQQSLLVTAGLLMLLVGTVLAVEGARALAYFISLSRKRAARYRLKAAIIASLLLLNFPLALTYCHIATNQIFPAGD